MANFGFKKRTEECSQQITRLLADHGVFLNPSIMKIGEIWRLSLDDRVTLSKEKKDEESVLAGAVAPGGFEDDGWFTSLKGRVFWTEKEVETKFIIPLLSRLGYTEDDTHSSLCGW